MTSISQPVLPPQAPSNAAPSQAAGSAGKPSYAGATKKTISPTSASGSSTPSTAVNSTQNGRQDINSTLNGRPIQPAVPAAGTPPITNGNTPTSSTSGLGDHARKPSVTISAAGTSGYLPNGGPVAGKSKGGSNIQFGSVAEGSPAAANAIPAPKESTKSLTVNSPANPRVTSPQGSPSPIPQPPPSGGRPPSSLHGTSNSMSFGSFGGPDANVSFNNVDSHHNTDANTIADETTWRTSRSCCISTTTEPPPPRVITVSTQRHYEQSGYGSRCRKRWLSSRRSWKRQLPRPVSAADGSRLPLS